MILMCNININEIMTNNVILMILLICINDNEIIIND